MEQYASLGIETFILSGYPHLEEAYRFAELVFPRLPGHVRQRIEAPLSGPFGEVVGNSYLPKLSQS
jgi:alkanesulfonate monooxygenase